MLVEINKSGVIIDYQGNKSILPDINVNHSIQSLIPGLETESYDENFLIPFYQLNQQQVVDLHHHIANSRHHLILIPQDQVFKEIQTKQQVALESQLQNQNLRIMLNALEKAQQQLKQANQDKSFLISALSHEMGTPLNSIQGHAQMALKDPNTTEQALEVIIRNSHHLQEIIKQTLHIDKNEAVSEKQSFNLSVLLHDLHDSLSPLASFKALAFTINCPKSVTLYAHKAQWQQILTNLISNAIKYTEVGKIHIEVQAGIKGLAVDVIDTGIGISPDFQNKLFQSWQRERQGHAKGSGIGLAIAKMLAEGMNLTLSLAYSSDKGSCFRIAYPEFKHSTQKVLLIEDDDDLRRLFAYYLHQLNLDIDQAASWQEVKKKYKTRKFDVVLTDRNLSDGQAEDHINLLKQLADKVLVMTGNPNKNQIEVLYQKGFDQVLSKPLNQSQLTQALLN
ncbi:ATP-binding response regulator [Marinicella rhabdoformis]|uniref:ATP-binding response regulator n=1 Tax=Marinicella rhabdoformis TaxID=2580566 RepID=UPI0012AED0A9|nr:hybrid sensor histidine kinase/response regulator [Marinicella rhabdoformis]